MNLQQLNKDLLTELKNPKYYEDEKVYDLCENFVCLLDKPEDFIIHTIFEKLNPKPKNMSSYCFKRLKDTLNYNPFEFVDYMTLDSLVEKVYPKSINLEDHVKINIKHLTKTKKDIINFINSLDRKTPVYFDFEYDVDDHEVFNCYFLPDSKGDYYILGYDDEQIGFTRDYTIDDVLDCYKESH